MIQNNDSDKVKQIKETDELTAIKGNKHTDIKNADIRKSVENKLPEDVKKGVGSFFTVRGVGISDPGTLVDPELIVICRHCGKPIDQSTLIGLSLRCPSCGKPQNGHPQNPTLDPYEDMTVICKHCTEPINQARLRGISLICPKCGMPQNGQPHPKV